jgi:DNA replication and repair protein RecF
VPHRVPQPPALALRRLVLTDFRGYARLDWRPEARLTAIVGPNGAGKTNLLEAISLLVPGRGLRGARIAEIARRDGPGGFAVAARLDTPDGRLDIGTAADPGATRRRTLLDGVAPRNQGEIAARLAAVWITPAMDALFREAASARRRFLDRLVWAFDPGHAREVAAYETALVGRNRLLAAGAAEPAWLAGLEDAMARHGIAVAAARRSLVARLDRVLAEGRLHPFPAARLAMRCGVAESLEAGPALAAEEDFRQLLARTRPADRAAGGATLGPHRADLEVTHAAKTLPASLASTGEQKALLVAIVLAHAGLIAEARGAPPLLLLDEPMTHLDESHRMALFETLASLPGQAFLTGTDLALFRPLSGRAEAVQPGPGAIVPSPGFLAPGAGFLL